MRCRSLRLWPFQNVPLGVAALSSADDPSRGWAEQLGTLLPYCLAILGILGRGGSLTESVSRRLRMSESRWNR